MHLLINLVIISMLFTGCELFGPAASQTQPPVSQDLAPTQQAPTTNKELPQSQGYINFSPEVFESHADKRRILFFHASWCPTCKQANQEFLDKGEDIPEDVVILKLDYDTETELKNKYGITYQHTFVLVDSAGQEIKKWNGGGIQQMLTQIAP